MLTLVPEQPQAEAVAVQGDRIVAVGSASEVKDYIGPRTEVLDMGGLTVVPGLADTHLHLLAYGFALNQVDLLGVRSIAELRRRVADFVAERRIQPGRWVVGRGW
ncbi:MAG TPA: amidohydrolase family protein, partial [Firmicutes bacterium]|nr:amidohydrolase family protein [Bacillota bacterium]